MVSQHIAPFDAIPVEVLVLILLSVSPPVLLVHCRLISKRFKDCIDGSLSLQYAIRLVAYGYEPVPDYRGDLSTSACLELLENHVRPWAMLEYEQHNFMVPTARSWSLAQGVYANIDNTALRDTICILHLPSRHPANDAIPRQRVVESPVDYSSNDIVIDPSQDLLILVAPSVKFAEHSSQIH
jgi:hypothetical protein